MVDWLPNYIMTGDDSFHKTRHSISAPQTETASFHIESLCFVWIRLDNYVAINPFYCKQKAYLIWFSIRCYYNILYRVLWNMCHNVIFPPSLHLFSKHAVSRPGETMHTRSTSFQWGWHRHTGHDRTIHLTFQSMQCLYSPILINFWRTQRSKKATWRRTTSKK